MEIEKNADSYFDQYNTDHRDSGSLCRLRIPYKKGEQQVSMYLLCANLGCLIINGSYMLLLQTETYEGAFIALKVEYFGNVVFYLMFGLFLWSYMKMKPYKWAIALVSLWGIFDVIFLFLVWTGDSFHLVFRDLGFEWNEEWGLVMLRSVPGIFYMIHYCIICLVVFCSLIYITVRMFLVEIPSERNNLAKLVGSQFVIGVSLVLMLLFNFSFDIVPIFASTSILSIIISIRRDEFFGLKEVGREWVFDQIEDAFILVDELYGYLDSNLCEEGISGVGFQA